MKAHCKKYHKKYHYYTSRGTLICANCPTELKALNKVLKKLK